MTATHQSQASQRSQRATQERLRLLDARRAALRQDGEDLVRHFRASFPDGPAYLTRYADGTNTSYRWRRSSAKHWRGNDPAGVNVTLDLTSEAGLALLRTLPVVVQASWLDYERARITLNLELALVAYERARLRDYLGRVKILNRIGRESGVTAGEANAYNPGD